MHPTTTHDTTTTTTTTTATERVAAALQDCRQQYDQAIAMPHRTDAESAVRARRLALACAREAAWLRLLAGVAYRDRQLNNVHGRAAVLAAHAYRDRARFWRDIAADWQARADQRPTSDAAGALSNWHELGVTA